MKSILLKNGYWLEFYPNLKHNDFDCYFMTTIDGKSEIMNIFVVKDDTIEFILEKLESQDSLGIRDSFLLSLVKDPS